MAAGVMSVRQRPQAAVLIGSGPAAGSVHVAFLAADRAGVRAFHVAALAAGGSDNGAPGLRPHYHLNYFAAFVSILTATMSRPCAAPGAFEDQFPGQ